MTKKSNKRPPVRSGKKSGLSKKAIMLIAMSVGLVLVIVALIVLLNVWKSKPENQPTPSEPTVEATVEETAEPTAEPEPEFTDVDFGSADYSKDFFEKPVNLTVSGQLEAEAMAMAFGKVYTFGPTFRAEKSFTTRHAAEFWMIEPEMAFCDLNGYMDNAEAMIKYVIRYVLDNCPDEMAFFNQFIDKGLVERLELVANSEFARISYTEAIEILKKNNKKFQYPVEWGVDIQTEHERYLTEVVYKKPVFVTDYPKEIKSFYMKQNADGKTVAAADMLVPGIGELIGGSQREENYDKLVARMDELGMDKTNYEWYLNLRKFGGVEHAGYGLGFERMIMYLTGIQNIRDVLPFPRTAYGF